MKKTKSKTTKKESEKPSKNNLKYYEIIEKYGSDILNHEEL